MATKMNRLFMLVVPVVAFLLAGVSVQAQENDREQLKGLDEQVQEIKTDVLSIAASLSRLEEKLLYPSNTQVALFVSLAHGEKFRLDAVEIQIEGQPVAHHIYTFKELEALQKGGVQRIYTGNLRAGSHTLQVAMIGKGKLGGDLRREEKFTIQKGVGPQFVEISLASNGIKLKD